MRGGGRVSECFICLFSPMSDTRWERERKGEEENEKEKRKGRTRERKS